jgi:hypothetical protein
MLPTNFLYFVFGGLKLTHETKNQSSKSILLLSKLLFYKWPLYMTSDIFDQRPVTDKLIDLDVSFYFYPSHLSAHLKQ